MLKNWKKINEQNITVGFRKILRKTFEMPDGRHAEFDIRNDGSAVCVVALTKEKEVILAKQFRPGPEKIVLEIPGGRIDEGESPEEAIKRELLEETGFSGKIEFAGKIPVGTYSNASYYTFVALDCEKISEQKLEPNEYIEVEFMSLDDFRKHIRDGNLSNVASAYTALDYLNML